MKFRVWDKVGQVMYYDGFRLSQKGELSYDIWHPNSNRLPSGELSLVVMFSTGVTDRDGKEIWEDDIIEVTTSHKGIKRLEVSRSIMNYGFVPSITKVLGNKWQNPELLEKSDG